VLAVLGAERLRRGFAVVCRLPKHQ
jgi:hypothetical protein